MPNSEPSMKAMEEELEELNKKSAAIKARMTRIQSQLTPNLVKFSQFVTDKDVRGAAGVLTSFKFPAGIYKPAHRVQVNLTPKPKDGHKGGPKGGRSRKHKVKSQRRRKSSRRNH
jgi:hypothetical protein